MILTENQLLKINETKQFMIDYCEDAELQEYESYDLYSHEDIEKIIEEGESIENIMVEFPCEDECMVFDTETFLKLSSEIQSIDIINNGFIKTNLQRFYIVSLNDSDHAEIIREHCDIEPVNNNGITINLISESIFIGLAATKLNEFDVDYWRTASQYLAVEIVYENQKAVLDNKEERELVNAYIFEIADSTGITLSLSEIKNPIYDYEDFLEPYLDTPKIKLRNLEDYNEGMNFFVSASQIKDQELKFLNFYKVLEHFGPIAVNLEANELMRKKLDAPRSSFENGDYIRSIFELSNAMRDKFNDEDLIKASFNTCFDMVSIFSKLPESIQKKIKKHIKHSEIDYSTNSQILNTVNNMAGKIIYKTRNKVVHAKSNFILTGEEVDDSEFLQLNEFMKEASSQAIRWYNRQPNHLKLEIIK